MQEWRERREEKKCSEGKKGTVRGETEGREKEREFFSLWMIRASMQVLIKRIQKKRSQALLCGYVGEGHLGGVNLTPSSPRALRRFSLVSSFCHWAAKLHLCTSTSGEAIGSTWRKRIERHSAHFFFTSPPYIHVRPNSPGRLWEGKWSTLFIHLGPETKDFHCEQ